MRVAIQSGTFQKDQDGVSRTLYKLVESLLDAKIEVGIWSPLITPQKRKGLFLFKTPSLPLLLYPDYKLPILPREIKKQMKEFDPDLIQLTLPDMIGIYLLLYATKKGIPVVSSYHTDFASYLKYFQLSIVHKPGWKYLNWFYNKCDMVYVPTEEMIHILESKSIKNSKIWSRGVDRELYNPSYRSNEIRRGWNAQDKKVILFCGRFVWYKDLEVFIRVYELFKKKGPENVAFVLAGDGPIRKELKRRMPDAYFAGYLYGEDLSRVYANSDILLFPSTTETFGNVILEALSSGVPAVVSNIGGCQEIIARSGGGYIVQARKPNKFYESCKSLVEDEVLYKKMQSNGLKYAEEQRWDRINGKLITDFKNLVNKKPS